MLLWQLTRVKFFFEGLNLLLKKGCTFVWNLFYIIFFNWNSLKTLSVLYVIKCGHVSHDSIVSHEVSKSMQKDRRLFVMQAKALILKVFKRVESYSKATSKT